MVVRKFLKIKFSKITFYLLSHYLSHPLGFPMQQLIMNQLLYLVVQSLYQHVHFKQPASAYYKQKAKLMSDAALDVGAVWCVLPYGALAVVLFYWN